MKRHPFHSMYGKIFAQIYDSSIAEKYQTRLVFQDMIILADSDGVVDMTPEAISRRTNVPLQLVKEAITELESPDPRSRTKTESGARIVRLDKHRDWGWLIVNHARFRETASDDRRRELTKERVRKFRNKNHLHTTPVTQCNAPVTRSNGGGALPPASAYAYASASRGESAERGLTNHPPITEVVRHFLALGWTQAQIEHAYHSFDAGSHDGWWMWGKRRVGDWRAAMETRLDDDKQKNQPNNGQHTATNGADTVKFNAEYERVLKRMAAIKGTYGDHQTWSDSDRAEWKTLAARKKELKGILGITV